MFGFGKKKEEAIAYVEGTWKVRMYLPKRPPRWQFWRKPGDHVLSMMKTLKRAGIRVDEFNFGITKYEVRK